MDGLVGENKIESNRGGHFEGRITSETITYIHISRYIYLFGTYTYI